MFRFWFRSMFYLLGFTLVVLIAWPAAAAGPSVDLRVGPLLQNPLGYGDPSPQFTWRLPETERDLSQTAYRIVVSSRKETLRALPTFGTRERSNPTNPRSSITRENDFPHETASSGP